MNGLCDVCGEKIKLSKDRIVGVNFLCQLPNSVSCPGIEVHWFCNNRTAWIMNKTIDLHNEKHHPQVNLF